VSKQHPTWLDLAHRTLDQAVLDTYGWPHDLSDEEILTRLLALNGERAAGQRDIGAVTAVVAAGVDKA
jgi:hypothetical protein